MFNGGWSGGPGGGWGGGGFGPGGFGPGGPGFGAGPGGFGPGGFGPGGFGPGPGGPGGPGFGPGGPGGFGPGFGPGGPGGFGPGGPGGPGFGPGPGKRMIFAAVSITALLLEGPTDTAGIVERLTDASGGEMTPPHEGVEFVVGLLAARGIVTIGEGTVTVTDFGKSLLAWRGVTGESARATIAFMAKFADVMKWHHDLHEAAGLARTIAHSGTDEQKATAEAAKAKLLATIDEVKKSLHGALA